MKYSLFFILFSLFMRVNSECCKRYAMYWAADSCRPYSDHYYLQQSESDLLSSMILPTRCKAKVCGDGRIHPGVYCGWGKCNVFGCNCDGGCIEGNAQENFRKISGVPDAAEGPDTFDPTTWG